MMDSKWGRNWKSVVTGWALALFALRKDEIKVVLTDLAMPLMDGIALIRTLQKMKPAVRIIASTGRGGQGTAHDRPGCPSLTAELSDVGGYLSP